MHRFRDCCDALENGMFTEENARIYETFHEKFNLSDSIAARQAYVTCKLTSDVMKIGMSRKFQ